MTMNAMVNELEKLGFTVTKQYMSNTHEYCFDIRKDHIGMIRYFDYKPSDNTFQRDVRQKGFIRSIIEDYSKECRKITAEEPMCVLPKPLKIKVVHFSGPVTTVIWEDGTKSQVRCQDGDDFDPEKGLALAIAKRVLGNKGSWYDEIKKWVEPYHRQVAQENYDNILKMFGIDLKMPKLRLGNFEVEHHPDGCSMKYVGPQDADEAKCTEENKEKKDTPTPTTDTTPQPANGKISNDGVRCSTCKFIDTPVAQIPCSGCDWHYSCWEANEEVVEETAEECRDDPQVTHYNPVEEAYNLALKIRDGKYGDIEAIIGFLGEALDV